MDSTGLDAINMIFSPSLTNGQQIFPLQGGIPGLAQITFACASYPSAGTITLEYQVQGSSTWNLATGTNGETSTQPATATANWEVYGATSQLRVTFAGLSGGSGPLLAATFVTERGHPFGVYQGIRAITVQEYTEANVKRGLQFESAVYVASIAAGASVDTLFITGANPVIIKDRQISTTALTAEFHLYKNPTATAGASVPIYNLSLAPGVAATPTTQIKAVTATTSVGTEIAAPTYIIGSNGQGQTVIGSYLTRGLERVLAANTTYLARFTNTGSSSCAGAVFSTWYEGPTDLPLS